MGIPCMSGAPRTKKAIEEGVLVSSKYRMSHRYLANFWQFEHINKYGLPSCTLLCTQIRQKSPTFLECQNFLKIFNIHVQDCC